MEYYRVSYNKLILTIVDANFWGRSSRSPDAWPSHTVMTWVRFVGFVAVSLVGFLVKDFSETQRVAAAQCDFHCFLTYSM